MILGGSVWICGYHVTVRSYPHPVLCSRANSILDPMNVAPVKS